MESILNSIKKMLGIEPDYNHFDGEIIVHINSAFSTLRHVGVGSGESLQISSDVSTWKDVFGDLKYLDSIKTYTYLKVKLIFDPPGSSFVLDAFKRQADELEWRINEEADK